MDLNGNRFFLLIDLYHVFDRSQFSSKGFSSELALAKALSACDNPSSTFRLFIHDLLSEGVLVFDGKGFIVFDDDAFMSSLKNSPYYNKVKSIIVNHSVLFLD